ncbi:MAG: ribosome small subunit-dependent GTPase A [Clostridiales Family XIII bacterium]|nr:ribosome small subunit-dependent GTPase A [Clostridiales Family XIII bacterium]
MTPTVKEGVIRKALSGFYSVRTGSEEYICRGRGILRRMGLTPLVGDRVVISVQDEEEGVIDSICARDNSFVRPPVANIDLFVCVVATEDPAPNLEILDRFLVTAEAADVSAVICVNKTDLNEDVPALIRSIYDGIYPVAATSTVTRCGIAELRDIIAGKTVAFAGPSGAGKSSLISLLADADAETGEISRKTGRGKHTTRHVEIYDTDFGAEIFDTPGYTSFEGIFPDNAQLCSCFPEIFAASERCRFDDCCHDEEPDCGVRDAVARGAIAASRYESYVRLSRELKGIIRK